MQNPSSLRALEEVSEKNLLNRLLSDLAFAGRFDGILKQARRMTVIEPQYLFLNQSLLVQPLSFAVCRTDGVAPVEPIIACGIFPPA